jgi:hypothetical protein
LQKHNKTGILQWRVADVLGARSLHAHSVALYLALERNHMCAKNGRRDEVAQQSWND